MKRFFFLFLFLISFMAISAQGSFYYIDIEVKNFSDANPRTLANLITGKYSTEKEKVRAIYSWIGQNIRYNTGVISKGKNRARFPIKENIHDTSFWVSANEMTARQVLQRGFAICDGYSKLFQVLCEYSGIESKIIHGFARSDFNDIHKFMTNHSWNAVKIDSQWHLLDVTWGAGYVNYADEFVQKLEEKYFLSEPEQFIKDHYPEDPAWTLLKETPFVIDYRRSPFKFKSFIKYNFGAIFPAGGIIEAIPGDTLQFMLSLDVKNKNRKVSPDPFFEHALLLNNLNSDFIEPFYLGSDKVIYRYVVQEGISRVNLVFNKDLVLRYFIRPVKNHLARSAAD